MAWKFLWNLELQSHPYDCPETAASKKSFVCSRSQTSSLADMEACLNDDGGMALMDDDNDDDDDEDDDDDDDDE